MSKAKHKTKRITNAVFVMACRCGDFQANKDIVGRTKSTAYKNKKAYNRKDKHKAPIF